MSKVSGYRYLSDDLLCVGYDKGLISSGSLRCQEIYPYSMSDWGNKHLLAFTFLGSIIDLRSGYDLLHRIKTSVG
jgi:hypothetical protein